MKRLYLFLALVGFIVPNIWVAKVSYETGNLLLYSDLITTVQSMFSDDISTIFTLDLLIAVMVFMIWSYQSARKAQVKHLWLTWLVTFAFGLGGGFPLFLYQMEVAKERRSEPDH